MNDEGNGIDLEVKRTTGLQDLEEERLIDLPKVEGEGVCVFYEQEKEEMTVLLGDL